jgi:hypothetical protein
LTIAFRIACSAIIGSWRAASPHFPHWRAFASTAKNALSTIKNAAVKPHDRQFFLINPSIDGAAEKIHHKLHFDTKDFLESSEVDVTASGSGEIGKNRPPA